MKYSSPKMKKALEAAKKRGKRLRRARYLTEEQRARRYWEDRYGYWISG